MAKVIKERATARHRHTSVCLGRHADARPWPGEHQEPTDQPTQIEQTCDDL